MEIPRELKERFEKLEAKELAIKKKIKSTLEYKRRKLDKDVREYTRERSPILFQSIERIGRSYGFHVEGTSFREGKTPH